MRGSSAPAFGRRLFQYIPAELPDGGVADFNPVPLALTLKFAVVPGQFVLFDGAVATNAFVFTTNVALFVTDVPHTPLTTTL